MNDNPRSGSQLESLDVAGLLGRPIDPVAEAKHIAARSSRRCALLAIATVVAWIVACGTAICTSLFYFDGRGRQSLSEHRYAEKHMEVYAIPWNDVTAEQKRALASLQSIVKRTNEEIMILAPISIGLFGVAALLSVWLTIASRRVALRQINANLLAITRELDAVLQHGAASPG